MSIKRRYLIAGLICLSPAICAADPFKDLWRLEPEAPEGRVAGLRVGADGALYAAVGGRLWRGPDPWTPLCRYSPALIIDQGRIESPEGPFGEEARQDAILALQAAGVDLYDPVEAPWALERYLAEPEPRRGSPHLVIEIRGGERPAIRTGAGWVICEGGQWRLGSPTEAPATWRGEIERGEGPRTLRLRRAPGPSASPRLPAPEGAFAVAPMQGGALWAIAPDAAYLLEAGVWRRCPLPKPVQPPISLIPDGPALLIDEGEVITHLRPRCASVKRLQAPRGHRRGVAALHAGRVWLGAADGIFSLGARIAFTAFDLERWRAARQQALPPELVARLSPGRDGAAAIHGLSDRQQLRRWLPEISAAWRTEEGARVGRGAGLREAHSATEASGWRLELTWRLAPVGPALRQAARRQARHALTRRRRAQILRRRLDALLRRRWLPPPTSPRRRAALDIRITAARVTLAALGEITAYEAAHKGARDETEFTDPHRPERPADR